METWYKPGCCLGVVSNKTIWNNKVKIHYRRLRHPVRLEGLWRWRMVTQAIKVAGLRMQIGTVSVERMWASLGDMFPASARNMTNAWWQLLANLFFLRTNYRHFIRSCLPGWCEGDALLAERIDGLVAITFQMNHDGADDQLRCWRSCSLLDHDPSLYAFHVLLSLDIIQARWSCQSTQPTQSCRIVVANI